MPAPARTPDETRPHTPMAHSARPSCATLQRYHGTIVKHATRGSTNNNSQDIQYTERVRLHVQHAQRSCPSGNKLKSRSSLGANVLSCWLRCDGERAVVIVVMTLTSKTLLLGEMLVVGDGVGTCVCICIWYCGCGCGWG